MFEVNNGIVKIDGSQGKYDNKVTDPSIRYGRNAVENYFTYLEKPIVEDRFNPAPILDFGISSEAADKNAEKLNKFFKENDEYLKALPPLEFEYRYMPQIQNGKIDKQALLGAAYEELGQVKELSVEDLDNKFAPDETFTSAALDINKDGKIDVSEYSASIIAADMLSKSDNPDIKNIDGTINRQGFNALLKYTQKSNSEAAAKLYSNIYSTYNLAEAQKDFNPNL